jgi:hypothetical protein
MATRFACLARLRDVIEQMIVAAVQMDGTTLSADL